MFMGPMHIRDHGRGCSIAGVRNWPRGLRRRRVLLYTHSGRSNRGASTPHETPEDSQVEPKF